LLSSREKSQLSPTQLFALLASVTASTLASELQNRLAAFCGWDRNVQKRLAFEHF
jgi:hypothetical protein